MRKLRYVIEDIVFDEVSKVGSGNLLNARSDALTFGAFNRREIAKETRKRVKAECRAYSSIHVWLILLSMLGRIITESILIWIRRQKPNQLAQ